MVGRFAVCRLVASFAMSREAFVLHGRLQGEERETAIGLTKDKQGDSKVRIDGTDGHKSRGTGAPDANAADNARRVYFYSAAAPNTEEHSSTGDAFTTNPDFSPHGAISSDCSSSAMRRCARVTRYEQLRPWDKELIPLAEQISTGARSIAPVSRPIWPIPVSNFSLSFL